ncbi:unnamed protein product [Malus baccata var. baccata]
MASPTPDAATLSTLLAAIDMGTNSFKLLIVRAYPDGIFFTIGQFKEPVVLGRDTTSSSSTPTPFVLSHHSHLLALESLKKFQKILKSYKITVNKAEFLECVREEVDLEVDVLPGEEEARLVYLGMVQFLPIYEKLVLGVDIEGGNVVLGASLKLGHVNLTQKFGASEGNTEIMRDQIRLVIQESGLVENIQSCGFEVVVGSSGTIKAVENAVGNLVSLGDGKRDWKLSRGEVKGVVGSLCGGGEAERVRKGKFYKRWSEFMVAGAVLLEEIFEVLGIEEMGGFSLCIGRRGSLRKCDHLTNIQVLPPLTPRIFNIILGFPSEKRNGNHLHGYSTEEVKLIALRAKHHGKNLPNFDHVKKKFRFLCAIICTSAALQQHRLIGFQHMEISHSQEGFRLACSSVKDQNYPLGIVQTLAEDIGDELRQELAHFKMAFQEGLYIVVPSSASE